SLATDAITALGEVESLELQARGREHAAERLQAEWDEVTESRRSEIESDRLDRWSTSGAAYRKLAAAVTDSSRASAALWTAADHFRRGHDFAAADAALSELVELRIPRLEAAALVRRGRCRLDLGRPTEAAADFRTVL